MPVTGRSQWDEGLTVRIRYEPTHGRFEGYVLVTSVLWDEGGYRQLEPSLTPEDVYEQVFEEIGMWGVNLIERLRDAVRLV